MVECVSRRALLGAGAAALAVSALPEPAWAAKSNADPAVTARLQQLFKDSDEADLKLNPISALFRGDERYADQFGDYLSQAYRDANAANRAADTKALASIDRRKLSAKDQIAYDVFRYQTDVGRKGLEFAMLQRWQPIDHFTGIHLFFADFSSGQSAAQFRTLRDYENNLKRISGFVSFLDEAIVGMREGMVAGVVPTKMTMRNVSSQLDGMLKLGVDKSPFLMPVAKFPEGIATADQERLRTATRSVVERGVIPAYQRLKDFIDSSYLPACRDKVGLLGMKDGDALYAYLVETNTTTQMSPDAIHKLGLAEVARIRAEMEAVKKQVGFQGDVKAFFAFLRTDPRFYFETREALIGGYQSAAQNAV
jgi:uncharacterized protein (DUF885 family)